MPGKMKFAAEGNTSNPCLQRRNQHLTAVDHLAARLVKVLAILERHRRPDNRGTVQRVGVEAVLDPLQRLDQVRMPHRQANPQASQRARLGQRLGHQQVG
jgi:hypothetical protein